MIAEQTDPVSRAIESPARDERSMHILELAVAGIAILVSLLLSLAR